MYRFEITMHDDGLGFVEVGHPARGIEKDLAPEVPRQVYGLVVQDLVQRTAQQEKKRNRERERSVVVMKIM
jgi:hypothetical protein